VDNLAPRNTREIERCTLDLSAGQPIRVCLVTPLFRGFAYELINAFSRLRGLFGDTAMKLRGDAQRERPGIGFFRFGAPLFASFPTRSVGRASKGQCSLVIAAMHPWFNAAICWSSAARFW
jgi:hypothetical protein